MKPAWLNVSLLALLLSGVVVGSLLFPAPQTGLWFSLACVVVVWLFDVALTAVYGKVYLIDGWRLATPESVEELRREHFSHTSDG